MIITFSKVACYETFDGVITTWVNMIMNLGGMLRNPWWGDYLWVGEYFSYFSYITQVSNYESLVFTMESSLIWGSQSSHVSQESKDPWLSLQRPDHHQDTKTGGQLIIRTNRLRKSRRPVEWSTRKKSLRGGPQDPSHFVFVFVRACFGSIFGAILPFGPNKQFEVHYVFAQRYERHRRSTCLPISILRSWVPFQGSCRNPPFWW